MGNHIQKIVFIGFVFFAGFFSEALNAKDKRSVRSSCAKVIARQDKVIHHDPYRWLEQPSDERTKWIEDQGEIIEKYLQGIPKITDFWKSKFYKAYDQPDRLRRVKLNNNFSIELIDQGLGKPNEIFLLKGEKIIRKLFSSHDISKDGSIGVTTFWMDPSRKHIVVPVVESGSLDVADLHIIDIETGKSLEVLRRVHDEEIVWTNKSEFIYGRYINSDAANYIHKIGTPIENDLRFDDSKDNYFNSPDGSILGVTKDKKTTLRLLDQASQETLDFEVSEIIAVTKDAIFVETKNRDGWAEIVQIPVSKTPSGRISLGQYQTINTGKGNFDKFFTDKGEVLLSMSLGERRWAVLIDKLGEAKRIIELTNAARLISFKVLPKGKIKLGFESQVVEEKDFIYDIEANQFELKKSEIDKSLLTDENGVRFINTYISVESADGKKFPVRIVHKKGLKLDSNNPAMVEGYGGFNISGYLDPDFKEELKQFLDDGGIYVAPALRGGNELGPDWHRDATYEDGDKQNTFNDMIATLEMLKNKKYSRPDKIAIEGWSNGGYLVGGMIAQAPHLFKLGIPGNGVQDQLRKQILDSRFDGWAYEYGDPEKDVDAFKALSKLSPVNLIRKNKGYPAVLIIVGQNDSRVNSSHSYKLAAALQKFQQSANPIFMLAVDKSGHWVSLETLQDTRAYRTQWIKWSVIYDQLGITPKPD